jgi:predicted DNA-binding transcriptional regulator AlpA
MVPLFSLQRVLDRIGLRRKIADRVGVRMHSVEKSSMEPELLTDKEVADRLGMGTSTVWARSNPNSAYYDAKFPARVKNYGMTRWRADAVSKYIDYLSGVSNPRSPRVPQPQKGAASRPVGATHSARSSRPTVNESGARAAPQERAGRVASVRVDVEQQRILVRRANGQIRAFPLEGSPYWVPSEG